MKINHKLSLLALTLLSIPGLTYADCGYDSGTGEITPCGTSNADTVGTIVINITKWILGFGGAIAVLFIIWGGVQYLTAAGNEKQVAAAKTTLTNAIIGLAVILLSGVIILLVVNTATAITTSSTTP